MCAVFAGGRNNIVLWFKFILNYSFGGYEVFAIMYSSHSCSCTTLQHWFVLDSLALSERKIINHYFVFVPLQICQFIVMLSRLFLNFKSKVFNVYQDAVVTRIFPKCFFLMVLGTVLCEEPRIWKQNTQELSFIQIYFIVFKVDPILIQLYMHLLYVAFGIAFSNLFWCIQSSRNEFHEAADWVSGIGKSRSGPNPVNTVLVRWFLLSFWPKMRSQ